MRPLILAVLLLAPTVAMARPPPQTLETELVTLEKQSWVAWQGHDATFFDHFLSDDHVEMGAGGPSTKADVVKGVAAGCIVSSYTVDHFQVKQLDARTAVVTYRAAQDTRCGGYQVPSPVWATSVYLKRGGRWTNAVYVHSPIPKAG